MNKKRQTYVSEPTERGAYQVSRYDIVRNAYVPIKGETYQFENLSIQRAHVLNETDNYETDINVLSADYGFWGIEEAISICNKLVNEQSNLDELEKQKLSEADKKIVAWNKRVNEMGMRYDSLTTNGIDGLTSPFRYFIRRK